MNQKISDLIKELTTHYRDDGRYVTIQNSPDAFYMKYYNQQGRMVWTEQFSKKDNHLNTVNDIAENWALRQDK